MSEPPYVHPTLTASYSRDTSRGETVHFFEVAKGQAVQVTQQRDRDLFTCEHYIIPQFAGASIYNSVKADLPSMMTFLRTEVDEFIDAASELRMLEVGSLEDLKEEFND